MAASTVFIGLAIFIARLAVGPLGPAELIGVLACVAAAAVFATIPFAVEFAWLHLPFPVVPPPAELNTDTTTTGPDPARLAAELAAAVDARLAAALPGWTAELATALATLDEQRRAEILRATAAPAPRKLDADAVTAPAGKPRLGRGLAGLIHGTNALAAPTPASSPDAPPEA